MRYAIRNWITALLVIGLCPSLLWSHPNEDEVIVNTLYDIIRQSLERVGCKWSNDAKESYSNSLATFLNQRLPRKSIQQYISELRIGFPWIAHVHGTQPIAHAIELEFYTEQAKWWLKLWLRRRRLTPQEKHAILQQIRELLQWAFKQASETGDDKLTLNDTQMKDILNEVKANVENPVCPLYKRLLSPAQVSRVKQSFSRWFTSLGGARRYGIRPDAPQRAKRTQFLLQRMLRLIETVGSFRPPRQLRVLAVKVSRAREAVGIKNQRWAQALKNRQGDVCNKQELFDWLVWVSECIIQSMKGNDVWAFGPW